MKTLITGASGQLGRALQDTASLTKNVVALTSRELDICNSAAVESCVAEIKPTLIVNAAAYTAVDKAEADSSTAFRVNGDAVGYLKRAAEAVGASFTHISTDFVFDGEAGRPYAPDAATSPLGIYGTSKLLGEQEAGEDALIVRTAWVYGSHGNNFVRTMLRMMSERAELRVVADQVGTPTWATSLAESVWKLVEAHATGIHHYTDSGVASWYDFAVAIQEEALAIGLLTHAIPILPIPTSAYPTPARRPHYSVLEKDATSALIGAAAPHWRVNLRRMLAEVRDQG